MIRAGKASLEADLAPIFETMKLDRHAPEATLAKLFQPSERSNQIGRLPGRSVTQGTNSTKRFRSTAAPHVCKPVY